MAWLLTTIGVLSHWATEFAIRDLTQGIQASRHSLPADPTEKEQVVREAIDTLQMTRSALLRIGITLYAGEFVILDEMDGFPGVITLPPDRFEELRLAWQTDDVPIDFYYPADSQHVIVESVLSHGGLVRRLVAYSPRMWQRRSEKSYVPPGVPTERARKEQLRAACTSFAEAILLRMEQLNEPGKTIDKAEFSELAAALQAVDTVQKRLDSVGGPRVIGGRPGDIEKHGNL